MMWVDSGHLILSCLYSPGCPSCDGTTVIWEGCPSNPISKVLSLWCLQGPKVWKSSDTERCLEILERSVLGPSWWSTGKESTMQCKGHGLDPWSGKIPHAAQQQSPWTTATEACVPYSTCSSTRGATAMRSPGTVIENSPSAATKT